jgi:hypothetical protein
VATKSVEPSVDIDTPVGNGPFGSGIVAVCLTMGKFGCADRLLTSNTSTFEEIELSTYQFSMTSHSFGNGRHFVSNLLM